ncbi:mitochondrial fission ELM1 family protein [Haloferula sp.]|uniref:mitochondrial fission ELM1 family protein n=1 Tax=Haloferula sp. TaxID=2497595 RepID=UPI003C763F70
MNETLQILLLSDGKPGHENQSRGLAEALGRLTKTEVTILPVKKRHLLASLFSSGELHDEIPRPELIIGAGHAVHGRMLAIARRNDIPSVVLMKPTLPSNLFDLCLIPRHDLKGRKPRVNMIATRGALNRVPSPDERPRNGGLILVGGPSGSYGWDSRAISTAIRIIVKACGERPWRVTNSRRTPEGELESLAKNCPALITHPHASTGRDWLPERLAEAAEVWVTEDSVSMIYEALSSGARVGLLPVPRLKPDGRVARGIDELIADRYLTPFDHWEPSNPLPEPPEVLRESERCAVEVLKRFFPSLLPNP